MALGPRGAIATARRSLARHSVPPIGSTSILHRLGRRHAQSLLTLKDRTMQPVDVAIIGAGPYGLSLAAHFRELGLDYRIFGKPMQSWRENMPADMLLKSEGFASNLDDPSGQATLERFCAEGNLPYADVGLPVPLSTLVSYGLA